jgi:hypothetical protein
MRDGGRIAKKILKAHGLSLVHFRAVLPGSAFVLHPKAGRTTPYTYGDDL